MRQQIKKPASVGLQGWSGSAAPVQAKSQKAERLEGQGFRPAMARHSLGKIAVDEKAGNSKSFAPRPNQTGLPNRVKRGVEALSGISLDHVRVHYNSPEPADVAALAYTQGDDIYVAPGEEEHLPHEAWHVAQQQQGRVKPTVQLAGMAVNDDSSLEREADSMGELVLTSGTSPSGRALARQGTAQSPVQRRRLDGKSRVVQRTIGKDVSTRLNNLTQLNTALAALNPMVAAINLADFGVPGLSAEIMDAVIAADTNILYDSIDREDVIEFYWAALTAGAAARRATYVYDPHGDKHFPGGRAGTKFSGTKEDVNPILEGMIGEVIGRIRQDADGQNRSYYYTVADIPQSGGRSITIQVDYNAGADRVTYHGYPDASVNVHRLSRTKGGVEIP